MNPIQLRSMSVGLIAWLAGAGLTGCGDEGAGTSVAPSTSPTVRESVPPEVQSGPFRFLDITAESAIKTAYSTGRANSILETVGGGVALIDFDQDGQPDAFFSGGGTISLDPESISGCGATLYRNDGGNRFVDVTTAACVDLPSDYSHGCIAPDLNNDGFPDLFVTCFGADRLYVSNGDGTFDEVVLPVSRPARWSTASAALDADLDGDLDLFIARYLDWAPASELCQNPRTGETDVCAPSRYPPAVDSLLVNEQLDFSGEGRLPESATDGRGLGVVAGDIDRDGRTDVYVANDVGVNHLYLATGPGLFRETALLSGVASDEFGAAEGSMGADLSDVNGDGFCDIWTTNFEYENNSLYLGQSVSQFDHGSVRMNVAGSGKPYVGFGTNLVDLDLDGWLDLVIANGHVYYGGGVRGYRQKPIVMRNEQGRQFVECTGSSGAYFQNDHPARGMACGDLDNDGDYDLVVVHQNEPARILRNDSRSGPATTIRLVGTRSNRDAVGAVIVAGIGDRETVMWIRSGAGYLSQSDQRILLPVDGETLEIAVQWPGGTVEEFNGLRAGEYHVLIEGRGDQ